MKIVNKDEFTKAMKDLVDELNQSAKNSQISVRLEDKKEGNNTIWYMVNLKPTYADIAKEKYWIGVYLFEANSGVNTFVVNGRRGELLFENKTVNAPEISLCYIKQILINEDEFIGKRAVAVKKLREAKKAKKAGNHTNGQKKKFNNNQKHYQKSGTKTYRSYGKSTGAGNGVKKSFIKKTESGSYNNGRRSYTTGNNSNNQSTSKFKPYYMSEKPSDTKNEK